jgi:hypothetical protein
MRFQLTMALAAILMLQAGAPASAATDVGTVKKETGHATAKATEDVAHGTTEAAKKTTYARAHDVSKRGRSIEKGASKTADQVRLASWFGPLRHFVLAHPWVVDV